jgi:hypothetical protein
LLALAFGIGSDNKAKELRQTQNSLANIYNLSRFPIATLNF